MNRTLTDAEFKLVDELRLTAERSVVTLAKQIALGRGQIKSSDLATPLRLADNLWIALTLEERPFGASSVWHLSVSLRGTVPPDALLHSIAGRLGLGGYTVEDDPRHGALVRHIVSERK